MSVSVDQILETVGNMTVLEVTDLIKKMEDKFDVSAAAAAVAVAAPAGGDAAAAAAEEKTAFDVVLTGFGSSKVGVIKAVRGITGLGLKEAKELVEQVPSPVKEGVSKDEADSIMNQLKEAGADVEVK